jgi:hypothetical protein
MKTLHLTLKKKWFDMIAAGIKKEEYREIKPYWVQRLMTLTDKATLKQDYDIVEFKNGYGKAAPTMRVEFKGVEMKYPAPEHSEWHDGIKDKVFIIKLGEVVTITQ